MPSLNRDDQDIDVLLGTCGHDQSHKLLRLAKSLGKMKLLFLTTTEFELCLLCKKREIHILFQFTNLRK